MKQRSLAVFGIVNIVVQCTLTMIGFHGLITELEVWKPHHQTLKVNRGQNTFQGNSNKPKYEFIPHCIVFYYFAQERAFRCRAFNDPTLCDVIPAQSLTSLSRLRAPFDDFPEYRIQFMKECEPLLATLDDSKPEHEAVLAKVDPDFLQIFKLADSIKLALVDLGCGKELERTAGPGRSSANSADTARRIGHETAGPSRQHCWQAHPTGGCTDNIRMKSNSPRSGVRGSRQTGSSQIPGVLFAHRRHLKVLTRVVTLRDSLYRGDPSGSPVGESRADGIFPVQRTTEIPKKRGSSPPQRDKPVSETRRRIITTRAPRNPQAVFHSENALKTQRLL
ncbi:hypothetical protein EVAR_66637_1 [Eumeta japonica]|uniref:Uncharacterized protein n=1 Tax=Eumeta variegata TaxID=151549 RepID=A0A4C1ZUI5_EUMVA|nr:hypothetical protein EVAR_66637_1 [Eumeta japonica]